MGHGAEPDLVVVDHPLVSDKVARLRHRDTAPPEFRRLVHEITLLCGVTALDSLQVAPSEVTTPVATAAGHRLVGPPPIVVGVLRAGLGMLDAISELVPDAVIGHIGLARDHTTLQPHEYLVTLPEQLADRAILVVDPMLATGGSAAHAIDILKARGASRIRLLAIVGAPEGVERLRRQHPDVSVVLAALDDHLNEFGYIVPGLGDAGDRLFGTH